MDSVSQNTANATVDAPTQANYQNLLFFQYLTQNDRLGKAPKPVKEARFYVFGKYYVKKITTYNVMLM